MTTLPKAFLPYTARTHAAARTTEYLYHQLIPYLGNKRKLLPLIAQAVDLTGARGGTFVDFFAGSGVVSRWAKQSGFCVLANDWEPYAFMLNQCHIGCASAPEFAALGGMTQAFARLNALPPKAGYLTDNLCPTHDDAPDPDRERLFFTRANGMKMDAMRAQIAGWQERGSLTPDETAVLLASFLYAASYVSNTSGVFKGFHHGWGGRTGTALYRILSDIHLAPPIFCDNQLPNRAVRQDAQSLAEERQGKPMDIAYLDPPYNQHPYGSNYHVLNTLTLWDKPPVPDTDKAAIRTDWRTERRSAYNHRATALAAYQRLLNTIHARFLLTSYSTDGTIPLPDLLAAAAGHGRLDCVSDSYKRYRVSAQRASPRPRTVEFVLIVDTAHRGRPSDVERVQSALSKMTAATCA